MSWLMDKVSLIAKLKKMLAPCIDDLKWGGAYECVKISSSNCRAAVNNVIHLQSNSMSK
jgi:hypothetical protein